MQSGFWHKANSFALAAMLAGTALTPAPLSAKAFPSLAGAGPWLNSPALSPAALRGKVVLVDFWTYSCINWRRTVPSLRAWAARYSDRGLVVVGVHTPEFAFEHNAGNVRRAVTEIGIAYPVVLDNSYTIWKAFDNHSWPAVYLVDANGRVRYHHFGEGGEERTESTIRALLSESGADLPARATMPVSARGVEAGADWKSLGSPETYVGYERGANIASASGVVYDRRHVYRLPARLKLNQWGLSGDWTIGREAAVLDAANGRIAFRFHARDIHLVMGTQSARRPVRFRVRLDGRAPGAAHGVDTDANGNGRVTGPRLYQLIRQREPIVDREIEIEFLDSGVVAYAFTFG